MLSTLVLAGTRHPLRWSFTGAFLLRPESRLGDLPSPEGSTAGSEVQVGASLQYVHPSRGFSIGPEARYATLVTPREYAFKPFFFRASRCCSASTCEWGSGCGWVSPVERASSGSRAPRTSA